jgi:hypothetical protein
LVISADALYGSEICGVAAGARDLIGGAWWRSVVWARPPRGSWRRVEPGRDHRDPDLLAEVGIDHRAEDDASRAACWIGDDAR